MKDEKFDELFDEAFERAIHSASPVDAEARRASWQRVQKHRMQTQTRLRRKRTLRLTGVAAGLILFGSVVFSEPVRTGALTPLYQKLYTWSTGEVVVVAGDLKPLETEGALTPPPPEGMEKPVSSTSYIQEDPGAGTITNFVTAESRPFTMEEAQAKLAYPMPEFPQVPADLKLDVVDLMVRDDGSPPIAFILRYKGEGERAVTIQVDQVPIGSERTYGFGNGVASEVVLDNGLNAQFVDREFEGLVHTIRGDLDIIVSGTLERDELLNIAGHIIDGKR